MSGTASAATMTYNGSTYISSSTTTCSNGTAALSYQGKLWCKVSSTSTPVALYSYRNDIRYAVPLANAVLKPTTVYLFWKGQNITKTKFYCCKNVSVAGGTHTITTADSTSPFGIAVNMGQFTTSGTRELYVDYMTSDGVFHGDNFTNFSINVATSSTTSTSSTSTSTTTTTTTSTSPTTTTTSTSTSPTTTTSTTSTSTSPTTTTSTTASYSAQLSWTIPSTRTDGTALTLSSLAGYEVYYTNSTGTVNVVLPVTGGTTTMATVASLSSGTYSFSMSAVDTSGLKSPLSKVVSITFP